MPQPVIQVYSPHGVEYVFLAIVLFMSAIGLSWLLDAFVNGAFSFSALSFPVAMMLITMPVFAWLFLRLKNAELSDSSLALDASKRRTTQSIQIVSFIICLIVAIGMLTSVFTALGGDLSGGSFVRVFFSLLMVVLVFGGILAYYWRDEHKG
ncbi:MAG: hypothetical protein JWN38_1228 [Candidatus Saccharibacteria bacterium]|nr:hypothetical protein [Candidatus Saccharibacteria bacterium]